MNNILVTYKAPSPNVVPGYKGLLKGSPLIGYLRYFSVFLFSHGVLIVVQLISHIVYGVMSWTLADQIEQYFWVLIGLIFVYKFISFPASLFQHDLEKQGIPKEKYQGEMLNIDEAKLIIAKINGYMFEEKPFLDPDYTITMLSKDVGIPTRELSKVMNQYLNQNFNDFLNNFRVEEFKRLAQDPKNRKYAIINIAYEAGFQSKSTFNVAFKKFTGETPSDYCKRLGCS